MPEGFFEIWSVVWTGVEGKSNRSDEVGLMSISEWRSPIIFVMDGEAKDGPIGVNEGNGRVGLELQILNLGYFVI